MISWRVDLNLDKLNFGVSHSEVVWMRSLARLSLVSDPVCGVIAKDTGHCGHWPVGVVHITQVFSPDQEELPIALSEDEGSGISADSYES